MTSRRARPCGALRWGGLELVLAALLVSAGCKGSSAADVSVTVSAAAPAVLTRGQVQLAAEVTGADDTTVTWSTTAGAIDAAGLFTAPAAPDRTLGAPGTDPGQFQAPRGLALENQKKFSTLQSVLEKQIEKKDPS